MYSQGSNNNNRSNRQRQPQYQQQPQGQPNALLGIQQIIQGIPTNLQNLVNIDQILQQTQSAQASAAAAQHQAQQQMYAQQQQAAAQQQQYFQQQRQSQARPPQQSRRPAPDENPILNGHNGGYEVSEQDAVNCLTINGHNNQVAIQECVSVPIVLANGHNNCVFSQAHGGLQIENFGIIDRLVVQGHNNKFEKLIVKELQVYGHNNQFSEICIRRVSDHGQNNKLRHMYDFTELSQRSQMSQQSAVPSSRAAQSRGITQRVRQRARNQQQTPHYEYSDEDEFEEYGLEGEQIDIDAEDEEDEDLHYEDSDDEELDDGNPSEASQTGYQNMPQFHQSSAQPHQMQTTLTLNINGQPVQINTNQGSGLQQAQAALGNIPQLSNMQQLSSILESINPYISGAAQQQHAQYDPSQMMGQGNQGFGGTFFTQDANNGEYFSSNGHTINIQGPHGGNIRVSINEDGEAVMEEDELLGEFPQDPEEGFSEQEGLYDEENVDSDGEPIPSIEEVRNIINSIPSFKFEEKTDGYESSMSMASQRKGSVQGSQAAQDSFTERKRKEIKRQESEVSCSICLEVLRTNAQVKALHCRHVFHTSCIHSWLKQKLQCPNCKKKVRLSQHI